MPHVTLNDGMKFHYADRGQGPALLMLHGWGTSQLVWDGQAVDLCDAFRVIGYDARGCGASDHPAEGHTVAQAARDALTLADALGLSSFTIVGSSIGGNAALEATLLAPDRIERLVLIDAPLHWFADGIDRAAFEEWLGQLRTDRMGTIEAMTPGWFSPRAGRGAVRWTTDLLRNSSWFIDALIADAARHDRRAELASIAAPVTLIHGAEDTEVPIRVAHETAALLPLSQVITLPEVGHMPHLENRRAVSALIRQLLS